MHTNNTVTPALQNDELLKMFGAKMTSLPKIVEKMTMESHVREDRIRFFGLSTRQRRENLDN